MDFDHPQFLFSEAEESSKIRAPTTMKKFEDSEKAKKPVRSMIETRGEKTKEKAKNSKKSKGAKKEGEFELHGRTQACRVVKWSEVLMWCLVPLSLLLSLVQRPCTLSPPVLVIPKMFAPSFLLRIWRTFSHCPFCWNLAFFQ